MFSRIVLTVSVLLVGCGSDGLDRHSDDVRLDAAAADGSADDFDVPDTADADALDAGTVDDAEHVDGTPADTDSLRDADAELVIDALTDTGDATESDGLSGDDVRGDVAMDARSDPADGADASPETCAPIAPVFDPAGSWSDATATTLSGAREYRVFVPESAPPSGERPMLVALHGCDQSAAEFAAGARLVEHAAARGAVLVLPEQPRLANPLACWNWFLAVNQNANAGESDILRAMVSDAIADHGADPSRVYVAGISAGGGMTSILLACHQDLFEAGAIVAGPSYMASTTATASGSALLLGPLTTDEVAGASAAACTLRGDSARTLAVHGSDDTVVHPDYLDHVIDVSVVQHDWEDDALRNRSLELVWSSEVVREEGTLATTLRRMDDDRGLRFGQIALDGLGHAWSGGNDAFPYADARGPDTTALLWDFFERPECFGRE